MFFVFFACYFCHQGTAWVFYPCHNYFQVGFIWNDWLESLSGTIMKWFFEVLNCNIFIFASCLVHIHSFNHHLMCMNCYFWSVVEFTRADDAATAIKTLDDYEVMGRKLKVREVCFKSLKLYWNNNLFTCLIWCLSWIWWIWKLKGMGYMESKRRCNIHIRKNAWYFWK